MGDMLLSVLLRVEKLEKHVEYKQRRIEVLGRELEQLGLVGGVVKVEVNEGAKEKMGLAHTEMVKMEAMQMRRLLSRWKWRGMWSEVLWLRQEGTGR